MKFASGSICDSTVSAQRPININSCNKTNNDEAKRWRINVELNLNYTLHSMLSMCHISCSVLLFANATAYIPNYPKAQRDFRLSKENRKIKFFYKKKIQINELSERMNELLIYLGTVYHVSCMWRTEEFYYRFARHYFSNPTPNKQQ